jgi:hypothetical protein
LTQRLEGPSAERAGELLHHLLNQSVTGLDFCILWQSLTERHEELADADRWVRRFLDTAELSALDRALALLPEPSIEDGLGKLEVPPSWKDQWAVSSRRMRDVTRLELRCPRCGWEIAYSMEHAANTEMRLPFDSIDCPCCDAIPAPQHQG